MAQTSITEQAPSQDTSRKLRFEGTVELGGSITDEMVSVLFGAESNVNGKLRFQGAVQIDGTFGGTITTDTLVVGEEAKVRAEVSCGSAVVKGEVTGNISARDSVELRGGARVVGDITTPSLSVEKGAMFEGASRMEPSPVKVRRPGR